MLKEIFICDLQERAEKLEKALQKSINDENMLKRELAQKTQAHRKAENQLKLLLSESQAHSEVVSGICATSFSCWHFTCLFTGFPKLFAHRIHAQSMIKASESIQSRVT